MGISMGSETFSEEIPHMPYNDEKEVAVGELEREEYGYRLTSDRLSKGYSMVVEPLPRDG